VSFVSLVRAAHIVSFASFGSVGLARLILSVLLPVGAYGMSDEFWLFRLRLFLATSRSDKPNNQIKITISERQPNVTTFPETPRENATKAARHGRNDILLQFLSQHYNIYVMSCLVIWPEEHTYQKFRSI
jgi:hypothetical protein